VQEENVHPVGAETLGLACFPTPGHASHHVCYLARDGTLYAGDAAGVRIRPSDFVLPPTPPPEVDLEAWERTLDELAARAPQRLALIHFGVAEDVERHLAELRVRLREWAGRVRDGASEEEFAQAAARDLGPDLDAYEQAMPFWQSYAGLKRYWEKRATA
jgi:glyoxylase-like metal-dependent hydrolase (beta-lactamase superfamily II)